MKVNNSAEIRRRIETKLIVAILIFAAVMVVAGIM